MAPQFFGRKAFVVEVIALFLVALLVAFQSVQSSVIGKINPSDGADAVLAIAQNDTTGYNKRSMITNGRFAMDLKPGKYKLVIDTREPYLDVTLENIEVKPGITTDLGDIKVN